MTLSPAQAAILAAGQQHPRHLVAPPARLAPAPRDAIRKSLLAKGLIEPVTVTGLDETAVWTLDGVPTHYRLTEAGLRAAGGTAGADTVPEAPPLAAGAVDAQQGAVAPEPAQEAAGERTSAVPAASSHKTLHDAAAAVVAAWDGSADRAGMDEAIAALRANLASKLHRTPTYPSAPRKPREGTKQEQVLAMLRRPEGATVVQVAETTGWQPHTVRGFFAGLKRRQSIAVEVLDRVRQVGPGKAGAKGSYSVYRIADAA